MVELAKEDVVIVTGGDSSMNKFIVQPDVRAAAEENPAGERTARHAGEQGIQARRRREARLK
jgi:hypothetical protein